MASSYTIVVPTPAGVPASVEVYVTAGRRDGKPLTRAELEALAVAFPPPTAEGRAALQGMIERAPAEVAQTTKEAPKAKAHAGTKAKKPAPKRAAAKRPASR
jgi:hypothetical protein